MPVMHFTKAASGAFSYLGNTQEAAKNTFSVACNIHNVFCHPLFPSKDSNGHDLSVINYLFIQVVILKQSSPGTYRNQAEKHLLLT